MPKIDTDHLKHGLEPVKGTLAIYEKAKEARRQAADAGGDVNLLTWAEDRARDEYVDACIALHGYIQATVDRAEGR